ncbi:hypothetical protein [Defluviicoccus vanus]|uniref:hypothetical protein n=1 Tax=Defluviicoccus vanus TaxID=111831 RepID=UPI001CBA6814|nr:hypothetical protein [Defluviicoccus vanus]
MATFTGTAANETITPGFVSATVSRIPPGSLPGAGADSIDGGGGNDSLDGGVVTIRSLAAPATIPSSAAPAAT